MFERFTHDAPAVVTAAVAEAERRGDRRVGTEHLLLGAIASPNTVTTAVMDALALDLRSARQALEDSDTAALAAVGIGAEVVMPPASSVADQPTSRRPSLWPLRHRPFTAGARQAIEGALREAVVRRHGSIGAEHVVLALCARDEPDPDVNVLATLGTSAADVRAELEGRMATAA
jgi:ATP-dependent Clp protease ATP-binding subunit ClpA